MLRYRVFWSALLTAELLSPALSADSPGVWHCDVPQAIQDYVTRSGDISINNISLSQQKALFRSDLFVIDFSFSVVNRGSVEKRVQGTALGMKEDYSTIFGVNANPTLGGASPGKTETASGSVYAPAGELDQAKKICVRFTGDF